MTDEAKSTKRRSRLLNRIASVGRKSPAKAKRESSLSTGEDALGPSEQKTPVRPVRSAKSSLTADSVQTASSGQSSGSEEVPVLLVASSAASAGASKAAPAPIVHSTATSSPRRSQLSPQATPPSSQAVSRAASNAPSESFVVVSSPPTPLTLQPPAPAAVLPRSNPNPQLAATPDSTQPDARNNYNSGNDKSGSPRRNLGTHNSGLDILRSRSPMSAPQSPRLPRSHTTIGNLSASKHLVRPDPNQGQTFHSYNTHFSTTCLPKYARSEYGEFEVPGRRDDSLGPRFGSTAQLFGLTSSHDTGHDHVRGHARHQSSKSYLRLEDSHLLYRTGSRLWEETRESKGQSWLGTRESSTALNQDDDDANDFTYDYESEGESDELSDENPDDESDDDGVLHIGKPRSKKPRNYIVRRRRRHEESDIAQAESMARSRLISAVDWLLGLTADESAGSVREVIEYAQRRQLSKREKARLRDEDPLAKIDVGLCLALISYVM